MAAIAEVLTALNERGFSDRKISDLTDVERNRVGNYRRGKARTYDYFEIQAIKRLALEKGVTVADDLLDVAIPAVKEHDLSLLDWQRDIERRLAQLESYLGPGMIRWLSGRAVEESGGAAQDEAEKEGRRSA